MWQHTVRVAHLRPSSFRVSFRVGVVAFDVPRLVSRGGDVVVWSRGLLDVVFSADSLRRWVVNIRFGHIDASWVARDIP